MEFTLEEYKKILHSIPGLLIVDKEGTIMMMEETAARECIVNEHSLNAKTAVGLKIWEAIPTSKIMQTFIDKNPYSFEYYFVDGRIIVSARMPVWKDGEVIAVLEIDILGVCGEYLSDFLSKANKFSEKLTSSSEFHHVGLAKYSLMNIIGESPLILKLKEQIKLAARYTSTVLIEGNTGTGKELVANAIHASGGRQLGNFVKVNCATIPDALAESELFGYEEGSFTGSKKGGSKGYLEMAHGGTIFLDEIQQLSLSLQAKLLRVLQEHEIQRVGSNECIDIDVRVIASSNKSLYTLVERGEFREDLYYRLNVINFKTPSLSEHIEDVPLICEHLILKYNQKFDRDIEGISPEVAKIFMSYDWPGNVRELSNIIERAMHYCQKKNIEVEDVDVLFSEEMKDRMLRNDKNSGNQDRGSLHEAKEQFERRCIIEELKNRKGNKGATAKGLKISRTLLYKKIEKYNINESDYKE